MIDLVQDYSGSVVIAPITGQEDTSYQVNLFASGIGTVCSVTLDGSHEYVGFIDLFIVTGAGGFTVNFPSVCWSASTAPTITTSAGATDWIRFYFTEYAGAPIVGIVMGQSIGV